MDNLKKLLKNKKSPKVFFVDGSTYIVSRNGPNLVYEYKENIKKYNRLNKKIFMHRMDYRNTHRKNLLDVEAKIVSAITSNVSVMPKQKFLSKNHVIENNYNNIEASVIIPCKNEKENLQLTVDCLLTVYNNTKYEIIIVNDASEDDSTKFLKLNKEKYKDIILINTENLGCSKAKNAGAQIAKGEYLLFLDAHVVVTDYWLDILVNTMKYRNAHAVAPGISDFGNEKAVGYGETYDRRLNPRWIKDCPQDIFDIPIACGCAFAIKKDIYFSIGGFEKLLSVWGREDEEISLKLWLYGYRLVVNPSIIIKHKFRQTFPYKVTSTNVVYNTLLLAFIHFKKERLSKTIDLLKMNPSYKESSEIIKENINSIFQIRDKYLEERKYDDDYFFKKFNIPF